ncbi:MAG: N-acetyltransferase, partial [Planctomycetes bacterium]|nr:N-acetyltransferase [Planctomycetota bacterium]
MKHQFINQDSKDDIINLFTSVFSDSEGKEEGLLIGKLTSELSSKIDNHNITCLGTYVNKNLVGSIFFTRLIFKEDISVYMLAPVAVSTQHQSQGIGKSLINHGIKCLKSQSVSVLVTYGDPAYYCKTGFTPLAIDIIQAPLKPSMPEGWLGQSLTDDPIPTL